MGKDKLISNLVQHMSFVFPDGKIAIKCIRWHGNNIPKILKP